MRPLRREEIVQLAVNAVGMLVLIAVRLQLEPRDLRETSLIFMLGAAFAFLLLDAVVLVLDHLDSDRGGGGGGEDPDDGFDPFDGGSDAVPGGSDVRRRGSSGKGAFEPQLAVLYAPRWCESP